MGGEAGAGSALPEFAPSAMLPVSAALSLRKPRRARGLAAAVSLETRGMLRQDSGCTFPRFAALPPHHLLFPQAYRQTLRYTIVSRTSGTLRVLQVLNEIY